MVHSQRTSPNGPDASLLLSEELRSGSACPAALVAHLKTRSPDEPARSAPVALTYRAYQGVQKTGPDTGADVTDGQDKACGHTLLLWVMRQGQVCLGHADGQVPKALRRKGKKQDQ